LPQKRFGYTPQLFPLKEHGMIDHIGLPVSNYARAKAFYEKVLARLGYRLVMEVSKAESGGAFEGPGFGDTKPQFWLSSGEALKGWLHIAFAAKECKAVDAFYCAALAAGAKENGAPDLRLHYHPNYYGAFVIDPDGHNIEAVCHQAPW
jgi:catechol 2,3-dioxygenase-like lactoylglutathione lyase family enzyme